MTTGPNRLAARAASTLTRVLLRLYPASFRQDVGDALTRDVERRGRELSGVRAGIWIVRLTTSLLFNGAAAWASRALPRRRLFTWLDIKLGLRMLLKYPGLTLSGGLGIAVAIFVGVGFFAVTESRFYPAIPLSEGDRLVGLQHWDVQALKVTRPSLQDFVRWRQEMRSVEDLAAFRTVARNVIAGDGSVDLAMVAEITPSGFRQARMPPFLGRALVEEDAAVNAPPVIVIGFDVWRTRFSAAPDIVGRELRLGRTVYTIVGVMPEGFAFPVNHRFWTPLKIDLSAESPVDRILRQELHDTIFLSGRLAPGIDLAAAHAELSVIGTRMAAEQPQTHGHLRPEVLPYTWSFTGANRHAGEDLWLMTMLASLVLIVVCINVAILVYARTVTRLGEIAVRSALGASRGRIVGQLFAESLVLSSAGAAIGFVAVKMALDWGRASLAQVGESTFWADYTVSGTAVVFVVVLTALAAVITGAVPALQATGRRVQSTLRQVHGGGGLRLGRTWTTLIVVQVGIATVAVPIVIALGWLQIRDAFRVPSFSLDQILFAELALDGAPPTASHFATLQADVSRRLEDEPSVVGHSFTLELPSFGRSARVTMANDVTPLPEGATREVKRSTVDLNFFRTFDLDLLAGRTFRSGDQDEQAADVVIVDRTFASRMLGNGEALGRRIRYAGEERASSAPGTERWFEIVGIVEDIVTNPFDPDLVEPGVYHPMKSAPMVGLSIRTTATDHGPLARRLREIAAGLDPALKVEVYPLSDAYGAYQTALTSAGLAIGVAVLSVLLQSAAGIYALMSFTVAQRRREIAIRLALGAQSGQLLGGIFRRALQQIVLGVAIGVGVILLFNASEDGEVLRGNEGLLIPGTVAVMTLVGLIAVLGPARRGLRIQPVEALKGE